MLGGDVTMSSNSEWNDIHGYTSDVKCPICTMDILVKIGVVLDNHPRIKLEIIWALCHVCFDKGWGIPTVSTDDKYESSLIYSNKKTGETKIIRVLHC